MKRPRHKPCNARHQVRKEQTGVACMIGLIQLSTASWPPSPHLCKAQFAHLLSSDIKVVLLLLSVLACSQLAHARRRLFCTSKLIAPQLSQLTISLSCNASCRFRSRSCKTETTSAMAPALKCES